MPFDLTGFPKRQLRTLIGMVVETRIPYAHEMLVIRLPLNGVARQEVFSILECEDILKNVDEGLLARQSLLPVEQKIPKASIASFSESTRLANGRENPIHQIGLRLHPFDPAQNSCGAVAAILAMFMCEMVLVVEIKEPLLMCSQQVFLGLSVFKMPVSAHSLSIEICFNIGLRGLPLLNFHFLDAERLVDPYGVVRAEPAAAVTYQPLWNAILADRSIQH